VQKLKVPVYKAFQVPKRLIWELGIYAVLRLVLPLADLAK